MKKIKILALVLIIVLSTVFLAGCGAKSENGTDAKEQGGKLDTIEGQYEKIRQDFKNIKGELTVENIEKVTGIKPTVIKDGVEEYGSMSYEYKFDYGFDYEAYITMSYSHNPKTIYPYDTTYVELKCPNELFQNNSLDMSSIKEEEFKADINRGIKVSAINNSAGGEGLAKKYQTSYKTGEAYVITMVWSDEKGNYINSSLRGDETVKLEDKTLSFVSYKLKQ